MYDVIIIGAGFSGLACAHRLQETGTQKYLVLEARDRVGGRTKHGQLAGLDIDMGGMWLSPSQERLKHYALKYRIATYPTFLDGHAVYELFGKKTEGAREKIDALFSPLEGIDYLLSQRKLSQLSKQLDCEHPWKLPQAQKLDEQTVAQWLERNVRSQKLKALYRQVCYAVFCAEADEMSMLFFLHYLKSGDGFDKIISSDDGGAQNFLFEGGLHQIASRMAEELTGELKLNSPVNRIEWNEQSATVVSGEQGFTARKVVMALPPTMLPKLEFNPPLPAEKQALHARLTMGSAIKFWVAYDRPFWREQGFNGMIASDRFPANPIMDVSPPSQDLGILAGFFDGAHAIAHSDCTPDVRKQIVLDTIAAYFGEEARHPIDYQDIDWTQETWSEGCYGAYAPPGAYSRYGNWLKQVIGPFHWAGTETASRWTGYVDGAISAGERAAEEIIQGSSSA